MREGSAAAGGPGGVGPRRDAAMLLAFVLSALTAHAATNTLGSLSSISLAPGVDPNTCSLIATVAGGSATVPLRLQFWDPFTVRYWLALDGNFSDTGAASDVIVGQPSNGSFSLAVHDKGSTVDVVQVPAGRVSVTFQKSPLLLSILVDGAVVVQESAPLSWNGISSWNTLARDAAALPAGLSKEWFFGGGMQNGHFSHRDQAIDIGVDYNWDKNGHPNSAPWYLSTAGYGVLRNTWVRFPALKPPPPGKANRARNKMRSKPEPKPYAF